MGKKLFSVIAFLFLIFFLASCEKSRHEVVFKDYTGAILKTQFVEDGTDATAPSNPVREGYDFTGWSVSFNNVTESLEVKAEYSIKKYSINFFVDGEQVGETQKVEHGKNAVLPEDPVKEGHTFTGWVGDYTNVTKNAEVNAAFDVNTYRVTFKDYNGYVIKESVVEHGKAAVAPSNPVREGYTFSGWSASFNNVKSNLEVSAQYDVKTYAVRFFVGDTQIGETQQVEHGKDAVLPEDPIKEGHTFTGWIGNYTNVTKPADINASFDIKTYRVTFKDYNGAILKESYVEHGADAIPPANPSREGHTFDGWAAADYEDIIKDKEIVAKYTIKKYEIKFFNGTTQIGDTQIVPHGGSAIPPTENPKREGHTFKGWLGAYTNVVANDDIEAAFDINVYQVVFKDYNGSILKIQMVEHGTNAIAPEQPTRVGYNWDKWSKSFTNIQEDTEVEAQYTIKKYEIKFYKADGITQIGQTQLIEHGASATPPQAPGIDGKTFSGWAGAYTNVVAKDDIVAMYDTNVYRVTFKDYNGYIIKEVHVPHGEDAIPPANPTRVGYTFDLWKATDYKNITVDKEITATYTRNKYNVVFRDFNGAPIGSPQSVLHGEAAQAPNALELVVASHNFMGWKEDFSYVTGPLDIDPIYQIKTFLVEFKDYNGYIIKQQIVEYGGDAIPPANPTRVGYTFDLWKAIDYKNITVDKVITATYTRNQYDVVFHDINGNPIGDPQPVLHGEAAVAPDAVNLVVAGYNFMGWKTDFSYVTGPLVIEPDYQIKSFLVQFKDYNGYIIKQQTVEYNKHATPPANPSREGYTFDGWDAADYQYIQSHKDIIAEYTRNSYNVTFYDINGDPIGDPQPVLHGDAAEAPDAAGLVVISHDFKGWKTDFSRVTGTLDIYPDYQIKTFLVQFIDYNGHIIKQQIVEYDDNAIPPANPSREGYTFDGWDAADYNNITADKDIIAEYTINSYQVTYDANGGIEMNPGHHDYGTVIRFPIAVREGYTFINWKDSNNNYYELGEDFVVLGPITLVAQWAIEQDFVLSFNYNDGYGGGKNPRLVRKYDYVYGIENPTRSGWDFVAWTLNGQVIQTPFRYEYNENVELLAIWTRTINGVVYIDEAADNGITVSKYTGSGGAVVIETTVSGENVTRIADSAFKGNSTITSITVPEHVAKVGNSAFANMAALETIAFDKGTKIFGSDVFKGSNSLETISLSSNIPKELGYYFGGDAFIPDSLTAIQYVDGTEDIDPKLCQGFMKNAQLNLAEDTVQIKDFQFRESQLTKIYIPNSVTTIGYEAFGQSELLTDVIFNADGNSLLATIGDFAFDGCVSLVNIYLGDKDQLDSVGANAFSYCSSLPSIVIGDSVTAIGIKAFAGCAALAEMHVPFIGNDRDATTSGLFSYWFENQNFTGGYNDGNGIYLPEALETIYVTDPKTIATLAFGGTHHLTYVDISGTNLTEIGANAFTGCYGLTEMHLPFIGYKADYATMTDDQKKFGYIFDTQYFGVEGQNHSYHAGNYYLPTSLTDVHINGNSITEIGEDAFYACAKIERFKFVDDTLTTINQKAFRYCTSLVDVEITSSNLLTLGGDAFSGCGSLVTIKVPNNVKTIDMGAFAGCTSLKYFNPVELVSDFNLPTSLETIGSSAFFNCWEITSVKFGGTLKNLNNFAFKNCKGLTDIEFEQNNLLTTIGYQAFMSCTNLQTVTFDRNSQLTSIGGDAFYGCSSLANVVNIPNATKYINTQAFYDCGSLNNIDFGTASSLESIGTFAFYNCIGLIDALVLPNSLKTIDTSAFQNCTGIVSIAFDDNCKLESIGQEAFRGCNLLQQVTFADSPNFETIFDFAFRDCIGLTTLQFNGSTVKDITFGDSSFEDCELLQNVILPESLQIIGSAAFRGCEILEVIEIPASVVQINGDAFMYCYQLGAVTFEGGSILKYIGGWAFAYCSLITELEIPSSVNSIGGRAFIGCSGLTKLTIPIVGATHSPSIAEQGRFGIIFGDEDYPGSYNAPDSSGTTWKIPESLTEVTINAYTNSDTKIAVGAFMNCTSITTLKIKCNVNTFDNPRIIEIGEQALRGCHGLVDLELPFTGRNITTTDGYESKFGYIFGSAYYDGSYMIAQQGTVNPQNVYIPESLTKVKVGCLGGGSINIRDNAFFGCKKIEYVDLANSSIKTIGSGVFNGCYGLTRLDLGFVGNAPTVDPINEYKNHFGYIFGEGLYDYSYDVVLPYAAPNNKTYKLPNSLTYVRIKGVHNTYEIYKYGFYDCKKIMDLVIGSYVSSGGVTVGEAAFGFVGNYDGCLYFQNILDPSPALNPTGWHVNWNSWGPTEYYWDGEWGYDENEYPVPIPNP